MKSKVDWRIIQIKPASEASSSETSREWDEEKQEKISLYLKENK